LGLILIVALSMLVYISVFKTMSPIGSMTLFGLFTEFFSGAVIPIPLMPDWLQRICYFLPLRWTADLPFRIYTGNIKIPDAAAGIAVQLAWIFTLTLTGMIAAGKIARLSAVQGG
jgi:ABC-2 type transport system permease protein